VVVFEYPYEDDPDSAGKDLIKRVVAVAGQHVRVVGNIIHVNGRAVPRQTLAERTDCGDVVGRVTPCAAAPERWCIHGVDQNGEAADEELPGQFASEAEAWQRVHVEQRYACKRVRECLGEVSYTAQHRVPEQEGGLSWQRPVNDPAWPPESHDPSLYGPAARVYSPPLNRSWPEFVVPEGHLLVMGDNRDNSKDGRYFGLVPVDTVKGKAGFIWFAFERHFWLPDFGRIGRVVHEDVPAEGCREK
jgi:hypothetical protein